MTARFKLTSQRQKVSRLSTKTSGRPYSLFCQPSDIRRPKQHLFLYSVCVGVVIPFILDVKLVYAPAGITREEGQTGLLHLHFAVLALIFIAGRIQPSTGTLPSCLWSGRLPISPRSSSYVYFFAMHVQRSYNLSTNNGGNG